MRTLALAALCDLLDPSVDLASPFARLLKSAHGHAGGAAWPGTLSEVIRSPAAEDARLVKATQRAGLSDAETLAAVIAIGAELDPAFARAVGWLQGTGGAARPTLGLLTAAVAPLGGSEDAVTLQLFAGRVAQQQWLTFSATGSVPLAQTEAQVPANVLQALAAKPSSDGAALADAARWPLSEEQRTAAMHAARGLAARGGALIVRALDRQEGLACADVVARVLARRAMIIAERQWPTGFTALASIEPTLPVFDLAPAPGEQIELPEPADARTPLVIVTGLEGSVTVRGQYPPEMRLTTPGVAARFERWRQHGFAEDVAEQLARRMRCGCAQIDVLAHGAAFHAASAGASRPSAGDVELAMQAQGAANFDGVGRLIRRRRRRDPVGPVGADAARAATLARALWCARAARFGYGTSRDVRRAGAVCRAIGHGQDTGGALASDGARAAADCGRSRGVDEQVGGRNGKEPRAGLCPGRADVCRTALR